jgi:FKBP-type peptidyl-prolyl cis-trans isomerase FkpA
MRKLMFAFLAGTIVVLAGCLKDNNTPGCDGSPVTATAPASEIATLKTYLETKGITATQDSRGFFYTIDSSASTTTEHPTRCSFITASYVGKLANDTIFDSAPEATPASFNLSGTILGWQEAIPLMKLNSTMKLYLPPSLGYGSTGRGTIPPNAILVFENVKLLAVAY